MLISFVEGSVSQNIDRMKASDPFEGLILEDADVVVYFNHFVMDCSVL